MKGVYQENLLERFELNTANQNTEDMPYSSETKLIYSLFAKIPMKTI
jgi:hypothetical protein